MKRRSDSSYGVIPIRCTDKTWEVLVIHQHSRIGNNMYWTFPKGHPELKETPAQTAARELCEETGLEAARLLYEPTFTLRYSFTHDGVLVDKTTVFFIGIIEQDALTLDGDEVRDAKWFPLSQVESQIDYQGAKHMVTEVKTFLESCKLC